jgi:hypothetical protein
VKRTILVLLAAALLLSPAGAGAAKPNGAAKPKFKAYASCDNGKPFKPAKHCRYDKAKLFRGTFVFESKVGKVPVKTCFVLSGPKPVGGGHACVKLKPLAYKAYPLKISGVRQHFSAKVTWFVKEAGRYVQVAASSLQVTP